MAGAVADGASIVIIDDFTNSGSTLFGCAQARCAEMHREIAGDRGGDLLTGAAPSRARAATP